MLSRLEAVEAVSLPALRKELSHPGKRKRQALEPCTASEPGDPLHSHLQALPPVQLGWATAPQDEALCNAYLSRYHPLGYHKPFGYWGRYLITSGEHRLGCILLSGATRALGRA